MRLTDAACTGRYRVIRNRRKNDTFVVAAVCDGRGWDDLATAERI